MFTLQSLYLLLVYFLIIGSFSQQFIVFLSDLDVKVFEFVERFGFSFGVICVILFKGVLLVNLINVLIVLQVVAQLLQLCFGMDEGGDLRPLRLVLDAAYFRKELLVFLGIELIKLLKLFVFLLSLLFVVRDLISFVGIDVEVFNKIILATASLRVSLLCYDFLIRLGI